MLCLQGQGSEKEVRLIKGSKKEWGRPVYILNDSAGCFLEPPGHPTYRYSFCAGYDRGYGFQEYGSVQYLYEVAKEHRLKTILTVVRPLVKFNPLSLDDEKSVKWINGVYAYFRHCYSSDGENRSASDCIVDSKDKLPPEHHLAYLHVKEYYPDYKPDLERIKIPKR